MFYIYIFSAALHLCTNKNASTKEYTMFIMTWFRQTNKVVKRCN